MSLCRIVFCINFSGRNFLLVQGQLFRFREISTQWLFDLANFKQSKHVSVVKSY